VKPGIQTKTILAFLIIAAISIFSTSIISIRQARSSLSEDLAVHFEEMAAEQYSSVARVIENGIQDCSLLAGNPIVASNAPPEVIRAELQAKQEILRDYEDITLLNPQGEVVTSRRPWPGGPPSPTSMTPPTPPGPSSLSPPRSSIPRAE
jgi:hypothetical protein